MYCIYCGRLCDYHETHSCLPCRIKIARNNERVYFITLLLEAYRYIKPLLLRGKIEAIIFPRQPPKTYKFKRVRKKKIKKSPA